MMDKREYEIPLEEKLADIKKRQQELMDKAKRISDEIDSATDEKRDGQYDQAAKQLLNDLSDEGKSVLSNRRNIEKKIKKTTFLGISLFILYAALSMAAFFILDLPFRFVYIIASVLAVGVVCLVCTIKNKNKLDAELKKTHEETSIIEYDKKAKELWSAHMDKFLNAEKLIRELKKEGAQNDTELRKMLDAEREVLEEMDELEFNFTYKDTILFYGQEKSNRYSLYLDGHLYDTVRGRQIIPIMLSPGIHSFKVENTSYNVDGSVIYCYTFNTQQIVAGEKPEAVAIVCEYNRIKQVNGKEFQRITKTTLI